MSTSKYNNKTQPQVRNKDNISDDDDFETEIGIGRKQLQTIINRMKSAEKNEEDEKVEKEKYKFLYNNSLGQLNDMDKKMRLMKNDIDTYKSRKGIKDVDLGLYDIDIESRKKNYDKKLAEALKEAQKEIEENRKKYGNH